MKVKRTHDAFYLQENRYGKPIEAHKFVMKTIAESFDLQRSDLVICDVGCAAGEFLYFMRSLAPNAVLEGYEFLPELVEKARHNVERVNFSVASVLDRHSLETNHSDLTTLIGVHSIFDEFETCFGNLIDWTRPGGSVYVFGMFNHFQIDVFVKYRESKNYRSECLESGWNMFSVESVSNYLKKHPKVASFRFVPFEIGLDVPQNPNDCVRGWTEQYASGRRMITNGLCLIQPIQILQISLH